MSTEPDDTLTFAVVPDGPTETLPALPAGVEPAVPPPSLREIAHETIPWDRLPAMTAPQPEPEVTLALPAVPEPVPAQDPEPEPVTFARWPHYPIGDALISSVPGFEDLPCGHCKAVFTDATPAVLNSVRPLMELRYLARQAGWNYDLSLTWTCPACHQAEEDRAVRWDSVQTTPGVTLEDILHGHDMNARATMTAGGRYPWDYDEWRDKYRPRPEKCIPEPEAAEASAA